MTRLSDTQLVILSAAAQRADLSVLPLPDSLTLKGGALNKVMDSLRNRGLIRVLGGDGGPERVVITSEGMAAIGVEADDDEAPAAADTGPTSAEAAVRPTPRRPPARPTARRSGRRPSRPRARAKASRPRAPPASRRGLVDREAHAARRHQAGADDRAAQAPRGRHGRADRRGHRLAAPHHPRRDQRRAQEEARTHGRGHAHPRGRPQQDRRQGQQHRLPDHRVPVRPAAERRRSAAHAASLLKRPGYRLYRSATARRPAALLAEQGLGPADLDRALAGLKRTEGTCGPDHRRDQRGRRVRRSAARAGARTCPTASSRQPFMRPLLWVTGRIELLGRRDAAGSTARFTSRTARCRPSPPSYRLAS